MRCNEYFADYKQKEVLYRKFREESEVTWSKFFFDVGKTTCEKLGCQSIIGITKQKGQLYVGRNSGVRSSSRQRKMAEVAEKRVRRSAGTEYCRIKP
jgi:hypothetical protein